MTSDEVYSEFSWKLRFSGNTPLLGERDQCNDEISATKKSNASTSSQKSVVIVQGVARKEAIIQDIVRLKTGLGEPNAEWKM